MPENKRGKTLLQMLLIAVPALIYSLYCLLRFSQSVFLIQFIEFDLADQVVVYQLILLASALVLPFFVGLLLALRAVLRPVRERLCKTLFAVDTVLVIMSAAAVLCSVARILIYGQMSLLHFMSLATLTDIILRIVMYILMLLAVWPKKFLSTKLQLLFTVLICIAGIWPSFSEAEQWFNLITYSGLTFRTVVGLIIILFRILVVFLALAPKLRLKKSVEQTPCEEYPSDITSPQEEGDVNAVLEQSTERGMRPMGEITREQYNEFIAESQKARNPDSNTKGKE